MKELEKEPIDPLIKEWLDKKVDRAEFEFSCGGDSMNETSLLVFDKKGNEIDFKFKEELIDDIYENVEFYENSDGHYQGEFGKVLIKFEEVEEIFTFTKETTSEYSESFSNEIIIEETPIEIIEFCKKFIEGIEGEMGHVTIDYKKDFYISEEKNNIILELYKIIEDAMFEHEPEDNTKGEIEDYITMSGFKINDNNKIQFDYEYRKTVYTTE